MTNQCKIMCVVCCCIGISCQMKKSPLSYASHASLCIQLSLREAEGDTEEICMKCTINSIKHTLQNKDQADKFSAAGLIGILQDFDKFFHDEVYTYMWETERERRSEEEKRR